MCCLLPLVTSSLVRPSWRLSSPGPFLLPSWLPWLLFSLVRFDIETAEDKLQLTKGIELDKKSVKRKINFCVSLFTHCIARVIAVLRVDHFQIGVTRFLDRRAAYNIPRGTWARFNIQSAMPVIESCQPCAIMPARRLPRRRASRLKSAPYTVIISIPAIPS